MRRTWRTVPAWVLLALLPAQQVLAAAPVRSAATPLVAGLGHRASAPESDAAADLTSLIANVAPAFVAGAGSSAWNPLLPALATLVPSAPTNVSGTFASSEDQVQLFQDGQDIQGTWIHLNGSAHATLRGTLIGDTVWGSWEDSRKANPTLNRGLFTFVFTADPAGGGQAVSFSGHTGNPDFSTFSAISGTRQGMIKVRVDPSNASLAPGASLPLRAVVAGSSNPAVTWTATGGSVNASGVYTAAADPGVYTVTARAAADAAAIATATLEVVATIPAGLDLGGVYATSDGTLRLFQSGSELVGDWDGDGSLGIPGGTNWAGRRRIAGLVSGRSLMATWTDEATGRTGQMTAMFTPDRGSYQGSWGTDSSCTGSPWAGTRQANPSPSAKIFPASVQLTPSSACAFQALRSNIAAADTSWTASGGSITAGGLYTAPTTPGGYSIGLVRNSDGSLLASAAVLVPGTGLQAVAGSYYEPVNPNCTLVLHQDGQTVWGTYTYGYGYVPTLYRVEAVLSGSILAGTLVQLNNGESSRPFSITFAADSSTFSGSIPGYRTPWNGTKQVGTVAVQVSPDPQRIAAGATQAFKAFVSGSAYQGVRWSCTGGTITAAGLFTAPSSPGTYTISATSLADGSAVGSVAVLVPVPAGSLDVTGPYSTSFYALSMVQSAAIVRGIGNYCIQGTLVGSVLTGVWYYNGGSPNAPGGKIEFTWNTDGSGFSGLYGNGTATPSYPWNGSRQIGVLLAPTFAEVQPGATLALQAAVVGTTNLGVNWTATGGTVTSGGVFTAPAGAATVTVTATSQASASAKASAVVVVGTPDPVAVVAPPNCIGTFTTNLGNLQVFQAGSKAWGLLVTSTHPAYPSPPYRFEGSFTGAVLRGILASASTSSNPNRFQITFAADGASFTGGWGYNGAYTSYTWSGTRQSGVSVAFEAGSRKILAGGTLPLNAYVGGTTNPALTWSTTAGSVDANGLLTAPATAGTLTVTATSVADPGKSAAVVVEVFGTAGLADISGEFQGSKGTLTLFQNGNRVWGTWLSTVFNNTYRLEGSLTGRTLTGTWDTAPGDSNPCRFLLSFAPEGSAFSGGYGVNGGYTNWGTWAGTRVAGLRVAATPFYRAAAPGGQIQLSAEVAGTPNKAISWSTSAGSIDASGRLTVPALPRQGLITVQAASQATPVATATMALEVIPSEGWDLSGSYDTYPATASVAPPGPTASGRMVVFQEGTYVWGTWDNQDVISGNGFQWLAGWRKGRVVEVEVGGSQPENQKPISLGLAPGGAAYQGWFRGEFSAYTWPGRIRAGEVAVSVTPASTRLPLGQSLQLVGSVAGSLDKGVVWTCSGGTVSAAGVFTPPGQAGVYTVSASSTADPSKTASATITVPVAITVSPEFAELRPGSSRQLVATVLGTANTAVTWAVQESGGGTVSAAGLYTAPAMPGTYHVVCTSTADSTVKAIATLQVGAEMPVAVTVTPYAVQVGKGGTATFTATVEGTTNPAVTWSVLGTDNGVISASGVYTAPARFGTYTVQATSVEDPNAYAVATVVVSAQAGEDTAFTYDLNGNMTSDGRRTFEWDAENRLIAVVQVSTGHRSEFGYNEMGRRVQIRELDPDSQQQLQVNSDKKYLWDGVEIAEERSADGSAVLRRFYSQGFVDTDGTVLYYTRDHLGSIRGLTDSAQAVRARYDYDPYGRISKIQGDRDSFFGYTGHQWHEATGLIFPYYRSYDANLGKWASRDPIGERGGINLFGYVENNPVNSIDISGLTPHPIYGWWCGPDWTGGHAEQYTPHEPGYYLPPDGALDEACMRHDVCYYSCRKTYPCNPSARSTCFKMCDNMLRDEAMRIGGFWGRVIGGAMDRPGKRDPGPNDCGCGK